MGFRDSSQDTMAVMGHMPEGKAMHQFYASTMEASMGDAREGEDRPQYYGDDHLWIVLAISAYVKETGDYAFLEEVLPFYDIHRGHGVTDPSAPATVLEHLRRSVASKVESQPTLPERRKTEAFFSTPIPGSLSLNACWETANMHGSITIKSILRIATIKSKLLNANRMFIPRIFLAMSIRSLA